MLFRRLVCPLPLVASLVLVLGALVSCGATARSETAPTTEVQVTATEFAFALSQTTFQTDRPYRFSVANAGLTMHEWVLTATGAEAHAHDQHDAALSSIGSEELAPGAISSRTVVFAAPGTYEFACHLPGHYESGMKLTITVE